MTTTELDEAQIAAAITANITAALAELDRPLTWLAKHTGIKRTTLAYQVKTGRPGVANLLRIAGVLGKAVEDLLVVATEDEDEQVLA